MKYDLIVAGGGFSGVSAAVSASRAGLKVLLIEKNGFLGGAACNNMVNPFMPYHLRGDNESSGMISAGIFKEILECLKRLDGLHSNMHTFNEEMLKIVFDNITEQSGVRVLFHSLLTGIDSENGKIVAVKTSGKSGEQRFEADYFIDATGDADLAYLAGCPYRTGRSEDGLCQPMTLCFRIAGVDRGEAWKQWNEINALYHEYQIKGKIKNPRENILSFTHMADGVIHFNSTRVIRKNPVDIFDLSDAERESRKQAYELFTFLKSNFKAFRNSVFLSSAPEIGVRESRMINGEYILTVNDIKACAKFEDGIAACNYSIDIHNPSGTGTSIYYFKPGEYYTIPYRCLQPKNADNLLVAGRCISTDHETQASYRIMPVCCTIGQAAGAAVALAKESNTGVKEINVKYLRKILRDQGAFF